MTVRSLQFRYTELQEICLHANTRGLWHHHPTERLHIKEPSRKPLAHYLT